MAARGVTSGRQGPGTHGHGAQVPAAPGTARLPVEPAPESKVNWDFGKKPYTVPHF